MTLFIGITFELWDATIEKDLQREIDTAVKKAIAPKIFTTATEEMAAVLDGINLANLPKPLNNYIDKKTKMGVDKLRQDLKKLQQKYCSAGAKTQALTPTQNDTD